MKKIILLLDGGAMSGVFGGGIVSGLQELNIYKHIDAIYAGSAGAFNAAYFLAEQTGEGLRVYLDHLSEGFIYPRNFVPGIIQRFINRYFFRIPREKMLDVVDVDYVIDVIKNKVPLNVKKIKEQKIDFFIKTLNIRSKDVEYFPIFNHDIFEVLRASCCIAPYTFDSQEIDGKYYIDGTIGEPIGLQRLRKLYPEHKIIFISNNRETVGVRHKAKGVLEGIVTSLMYDSNFLKVFSTREDKVKEDLTFAENDPNIFTILAPEDNPVRPRTRDRDTLMIGFEMGRKEAERIIDFLCLN